MDDMAFAATPPSPCSYDRRACALPAGIQPDRADRGKAEFVGAVFGPSRTDSYGSFEQSTALDAAFDAPSMLVAGRRGTSRLAVCEPAAQHGVVLGGQIGAK